MDKAEGERENVDASSRDVMHKNGGKEAEENEYAELGLGLSMNGRFGAEPTRKRLRHSSSVSDVVVTINSVDNQARVGIDAPLARGCSLLTETQEWRRRQEEARKKRTKNVRENENCSEDVDGLHEDANGQKLGNRNGTLNEFENWIFTQLPQGSSGTSDLQSHLVKGATQTCMTKSSSSYQIPQEPVVERPAVRAADSDVMDEEMLKNPLLDMPYVSTRGYGPNCNTIKGFLYGYRTGEDLKIVCVCHGMFLTPAEFVRHGGGGDVAYPLKHIVVNPFPLC